LASFPIIKNRLNILYLCLFLYLSYSDKVYSNDILNINEQLNIADSIRTSDPSKFQIIINKLKKNKDSLSVNQKYHLTYLTAYQQSILGQLENSIVTYKQLLTSNASAEIKFRARISIINTYAFTQNWAEGLLHLSILLKELPEIEPHETQMNGITVAAVFYNQLGQYALGLKYAEQLSSHKQSKRTSCLAAAIIIESKLHLEKLKNNNDEISNALGLCETEAIVVNLIRSYRARFDLINNKPDNAIKLLAPHLSQVNATKYPILIVKFYSLLAESYWMLGNLEKAEEFALDAVTIGKNIKTNQPVVSAYNLLYKIAKKRSEHEEIALKYHEIYAELDKAYINETKAKHLAFQLAVHKELEQKNQIALLNKQNDLLIAEQALIKANAENTRFILLILVIVISILLLWGSRLLQAHKRIKQLAEYDHLTGIYNRGHFSQIANAALDYCKSADQELSIIMFDLDYFKKVNDDYGHACGDWALKNVIHACKAIGRQNDIFARLGGEEFCILLTSCDKDSAYQRAETYRQAIADINTKESGFDFNITASFGVTDTKTSGYDLEKILADADSAAYSSKYAGRNQVTIFQAKTQKEEKKEKNSTELDSSRNAF
jgi:diguanylate cyclase (GGDEF)-like protein